MRDPTELCQQGRIAALINVVNGVAQIAAGIEHLALDVDLAAGQDLVDREQHARHVSVDVSEAIGVGVVLEDIQAQQDLTKVRSDYVSALAEYNKAQYLLLRATGAMARAEAPSK